MKNILYFIFISLFIAISCSKSDGGSSDVGGVPVNDQGQAGSMAKFSISGDYIYLINDQNLSTYDISQANTPVEVGSKRLDFGIETVFTLKERLFIGSINGMYIFDISDPANIQKLSFYEHITSCDPVVANDSLAFVTLSSGNQCRWGGGANRLDVLDITNELEPELLSSMNMISPKGLGLYQNYVFVCNSQQGVEIYDYTDPSDLEKVARIQAVDAYDLIIRGDHLFLIGKDGLFQYRINQVEDIELISEFPFYITTTP
ncbi:MAG: hypothetical protein B7C24_08895 [Bacteroidetes bacterium 4572_77]|nr:MAG: hypothetical protein B7C24_08895 [Bacteroidetes bacterium 4572_77]